MKRCLLIWLLRQLNRLLQVLGLRLVEGAYRLRVRGREGSEMDKKFIVETVPLLVAAERVPTKYRIDFAGASEVPNIEIPYASLEPRVQTFAVPGEYVATAGLYDQNDVLIGQVISTIFTVATGQTVSVNAVSGLRVEEA